MANDKNAQDPIDNRSCSRCGWALSPLIHCSDCPGLDRHCLCDDLMHKECCPSCNPVTIQPGEAQPWVDVAVGPWLVTGVSQYVSWLAARFQVVFALEETGNHVHLRRGWFSESGADGQDPDGIVAIIWSEDCRRCERCRTITMLDEHTCPTARQCFVAALRRRLRWDRV